MSSFNAIPRLIRFGLLLVVVAMLAGPALGKKDKLPEGVPGVTVGAVGEKPRPAGKEDKSLLYVKRVIGSSDDEWPVLQPRVERVLALLREANAGRDLRLPKPTDPKAVDLPPAPAAPTETSVVADRSRELLQTVVDQQVPVRDVRARIVGVRQARAKARGELATAQEELRELLTVRQEAVLIIVGVLE